MCMEDIILGRKTVSRTFSALVANTAGFNVPANGRRVGLLLSGTIAGNISVLRELNGTNSLADIEHRLFVQIKSERPFFMMRIEEFGIAVQLGYTMVNIAGSTVALAYTDFILDDR